MYGITQYKFVSEEAAMLGLEGWVGHDGDTFGFGSTAFKNQGLGGAAIATAANTCSFTYILFVNAYTKELLRRLETISPATTPTITPGMTATPTVAPAETSSGDFHGLGTYVLTVALAVAWTSLL